MSKPFMPKAVAMWLIENTSLTFEQIANFCSLHILEIESLANDEHFRKIQGLNPIITKELLEEEIKRCQQDPATTLVYNENTEFNKLNKTNQKTKSTSKYKKENKPDAILWLIKTYPFLNDYQISKLLNTTNSTIKAIRNKTHWNYKKLTPKNPVTLNLCAEEQLSILIKKYQTEEDHFKEKSSNEYTS